MKAKKNMEYSCFYALNLPSDNRFLMNIRQKDWINGKGLFFKATD